MRDVRLVGLLRAQRDLVAWWQLQALGWSRRRIEDQAWRHRWQVPYLGVYARTHGPLTRSQRWLAATLTEPGRLLGGHKERLDAGEAGAVHLMHARRLSPFPDRDSMLGVALDLSTHDIDVMRFLCGQEVRRVAAETSQVRHDRAEDLVAATLRFDGGATGLLETNWLTPAKVRQISVTGEHGMFVVDYLTQELCFHEHPSGDMIRYALRRREPIVVEWEAFLAALRGKGEPMASGDDGLAALSTARAIQRAGSISTSCAPGYRLGHAHHAAQHERHPVAVGHRDPELRRARGGAARHAEVDPARALGEPLLGGR
jgi:hypothetical protein